MLGPIAPYLVSFSAMAFAAVSALTLIRTVSHLDPPDTESKVQIGAAQVDVPEQEKIAV